MYKAAITVTLVRVNSTLLVLTRKSDANKHKCNSCQICGTNTRQEFASHFGVNTALLSSALTWFKSLPLLTEHYEKRAAHVGSERDKLA